VSSTINYSYNIFFVDAYSIFTWVSLLKHKSDALFIFQQLQCMVELQFITKIMTVRTDCRGEFFPSHDYLISHGINHRIICPHTCHWNSTIERKRCHFFVEMDLTLLSQASITMTYWDHAFLTTIYLINKIPSASINFGVLYTSFQDSTWLWFSHTL